MFVFVFVSRSSWFWEVKASCNNPVKTKGSVVAANMACNLFNVWRLDLLNILKLFFFTGGIVNFKRDTHI